MAYIENVMPEHASSNLVVKMKNTEEEVRLEGEKVAKIMEYFHKIIGTNKEMEE